MTHKDQTALIDAYYSGTLAGADKALFKQLMKEDAAFKQEVKASKSIYNGLKALHVDNFQAQMQGWERNQQGAKVVSIKSANPFRKYLAIAAAITLLLCVPLAYQSINSTDAFDSHFQAATTYAVHMGSLRGNEEMEQPEQIKKLAFSAYQKKNYTQTITQLKDYINTYATIAATDAQVHLVLGVSLLAENRAEDAIPYLETVKTIEDASYRQEGEWMWALAQYKLGNTAAAKNAMEIIANQERHVHKIDAKDFLMDI